MKIFNIAATGLSWALLAAGSVRGEGSVQLIRTPGGGIQPQAVTTTQGAVHLIYYKGSSGGGDIFYVRQEPGQATFTEPIKVNSTPSSAIAAGTIRGAQLALGKNNRPHVVWNGGKGAVPVDVRGKKATPLLYTRLADSGDGFEPERNIITYAAGLDGGSSVAADPAGNVYVAWHGAEPGNTNGEAGRAVFVAHSKDEGRTFQPETPATKEPTGACGCCGMKAFADAQGAVYILYRGASEKVNRPEILLASKNGKNFTVLNSDPWTIPTCPMSSATFAPESKGALAAWETSGQIYWAKIDSATLSMSKPAAPLPGVKRKHPALAQNKNGETILVWTEGTAWAKGGAVAWQIFGRDGKAKEQGRAEGVPIWSFATTYASADGRFVVVY